MKKVKNNLNDILDMFGSKKYIIKVHFTCILLLFQYGFYKYKNLNYIMWQALYFYWKML